MGPFWKGLAVVSYWIQSYKKVVNIVKQNKNFRENGSGILFPYLRHLGHKNRKLAVTFKYLIQCLNPRAHWMQNHERIPIIFKENNSFIKDGRGTLFLYLRHLGQK